MGYWLTYVPAVSLLLILVAVFVVERWDHLWWRVLLLFPLVWIGLTFGLSVGLRHLCIRHEVNARGIAVETTTGYCPINYYSWFDVP